MSIDPEWKMVLTDTTLAENGKRAHCFFSIKQSKSKQYVCICDQMSLQVQPDLGRIAKWVLRNAFDDEEQPFLPKVIANLRFRCFY